MGKYNKLAKLAKISKNTENINIVNNQNRQTKVEELTYLSSSIDDNINKIKNHIGISMDLVISEYVLDNSIKLGIITIKNLSDTEKISNSIIKPILNSKESFSSQTNVIKIIQNRIILIPGTKESSTFEDICNEIFKGNTVLLVDTETTALIAQTRKIEKRSIEMPINEITITGANDSFIEDIDTNVSMILRRIPIPELKSESFVVGRISKVKTRLFWVDGIANEDLIDEVKKRTNNIDLDWIEGTGIFAELIEDKPLSIFPKYRQTERPDMAAKVLIDGSVVILCDNSPHALIVPITFWDAFKSMDDYYFPVIVSSFIRILRLIAFFIAVFATPIYLSLAAFNQFSIPPMLGLSISMGRSGVPFPSIVEILLLTIIVDITREAGLRMPGIVGYTIGTIGAVVIGQAAVSAGYFSASSTAVVSISILSSFAIASTTMLNLSRILNYLLIILSSFFGIVGVFMGFALVLWYSASLESFSIPFLYPVIPFEWEGMKDTIIRSHFKASNKRLKLFSHKKYNSFKNNR
jgi:spore germination protein KA